MGLIPGFFFDFMEWKKKLTPWDLDLRVQEEDGLGDAPSPPRWGDAESGYFTVVLGSPTSSERSDPEPEESDCVQEGRPGLGWCDLKERFSRQAYSRLGYDYGLKKSRVLDKEQLDMLAMERNLYKNVKELLVLTELLGYPLIQENGQRRFGPHPMAKAPPKGCEVFVGKLPKHLNEAHIYTVFQHAGRVHQIRLMMDFNMGNRGFCFVQFTHPDEAQFAIKNFNQYEIIPGRRIGVTESVDNCRLYLGGIPTDKTEQEIFEELAKVTENLTRVTIRGKANESGVKFATRGFAFAEYKTHRDAAMARRKMLPGKILLWKTLLHVDWAEPEQRDVVNRYPGGKTWLNNGVTTVLQRGRFFNNFEFRGYSDKFNPYQDFEQLFQEPPPELSYQDFEEPSFLLGPANFNSYQSFQEPYKWNSYKDYDHVRIFDQSFQEPYMFNPYQHENFGKSFQEPPPELRYTFQRPPSMMMQMHPTQPMPMHQPAPPTPPMHELPPSTLRSFPIFRHTSVFQRGPNHDVPPSQMQSPDYSTPSYNFQY